MAMSQGAQKVIGIGVFVVCAAVIGMGEMDKKKAVKDYNGYFKRIKPLMSQQDALLTEVGQTNPLEAANKAKGWTKKAHEIKDKLSKKAPSNAELTPMHDKIMEATGYYVEAFEVLEKSVGQEELGPQFKEKLEKWQAALKEIDKLQQAYAKEHDLEIK
tara:strand:+ start:706 stop:1182 length:477 start_codon:yes stop_codon:yes gene_type:complete